MCVKRVVITSKAARKRNVKPAGGCAVAGGRGAFAIVLEIVTPPVAKN